MSGEPADRRGTGRATRLWIALQVGSLVVLALAAVLLVTWLAERPGLRRRIDLTADQVNTLAPATERVIASLPDDVTIDLFFRPDEVPFQDTSAETHFRVRKMLLLAQELAHGRIQVADHDVFERTQGPGSVEERVRELGLDGVRPGGVMVVSSGPRRDVLHVRGDLAEVDPGNPRVEQFVPARIVVFRGEEGLVRALLKVSQGERQTIAFATGHGEPDVYGDDAFDLARLYHGLVADGFEVVRWDGEKDARLPERCTVLALIGPRTPYSESELDAIRRFVDRGGRLVAAPGREDLAGPSTLAALLEGYGIRVTSGIVARPLAEPTTGEPVFRMPECNELYLTPDDMRPPHPITEPLRLGGRRIRLADTHALERADRPPGGRVLDVLGTSELTWRDLADATTGHDWVPAPSEERGPFVVAMAAVFPPASPPADDEMRERPECRVLVVGSAVAFASAVYPTDADFALNAFNWAASRDFRVQISTTDPEERRLDLGAGRPLAALSLVALVLLPGLVLVLGALTAWSRRR